MANGDKIQLKIASPDGIIFSDSVSYVNVPQLDGSAGFLAGHPPLISALKEGDVLIKYIDGSEKKIHIQPGILNVNYNEISIIFC